MRGGVQRVSVNEVVVWQHVIVVSDVLLGAAMDNVHKLIEMIEQRFGRLPATAMLLILVTAVLALGINTIFRYIIAPTFNFVKTVAASGSPLHVLFNQSPGIYNYLDLVFFFSLLVMAWPMTKALRDAALGTQREITREVPKLFNIIEFQKEQIRLLENQVRLLQEKQAFLDEYARFKLNQDRQASQCVGD